MSRFFTAFVPAMMFFTWFQWLAAASVDKMLTVNAMQSKGPAFQRGIPLTGHWAMMWLDLVLPLLILHLLMKYSAHWNMGQVALMTILGIALSYVMHLTYIQAGLNFPEAPTYGGKLTTVGWLHFGYMAAAFVVIGLFYLCTPKPAAFDVWLTTAWLVIHVTIGVHVPLKLLKPEWFPYHGVLNIDTLGPIAGATVVLLSLSWWALR